MNKYTTTLRQMEIQFEVIRKIIGTEQIQVHVQ